MSKSIYNPCVIIPCWSEGLSVLKMPLTGACGYNKKLPLAAMCWNTIPQQ